MLVRLRENGKEKTKEKQSSEPHVLWCSRITGEQAKQSYKAKLRKNVCFPWPQAGKNANPLILTYQGQG